MVQFLRGNSYPAGHEGVIAVAVRTVVGPRHEDAGEVSTSSEYQVQLVPVSRVWMSPRCLMQVFAVEEGIGDAEAMEAAEFQQSLAILVDLAPSV